MIKAGDAKMYKEVILKTVYIFVLFKREITIKIF